MQIPMQHSRRFQYLITAAISGLLCVSCGTKRKAELPQPSLPALQDIPAPLSTWPWPDTKQETLHQGVTHWHTVSADGTILDLLAFDFTANPRLHLEIFDQDEDDEKPFDNRAKFWRRGVGQITRQLNKQEHGQVIAAWNGLFFGYDRNSADGTAEHVSPVVLNRKVYYDSGTHRWTFGVQYRNEKPVFKTLHQPDKRTLAREFDWASGAAQCLIREGKPLHLEPFPVSGASPKKGPVPSTPQEAGHIPTVDHMRTSRVSLGWTQDNRILSLLFVKEPGNETTSALAFRHNVLSPGGWTLYDLQRFWLAKGVWGAINSDGGNVAQLAYLLPDKQYMLIAGGGRQAIPSDFKDAPQGGTLMYFYVRETE